MRLLFVLVTYFSFLFLILFSVMGIDAALKLIWGIQRDIVTLIQFIASIFCVLISLVVIRFTSPESSYYIGPDPEHEGNGSDVSDNDTTMENLETFTGTVVKTANPVILDNGDETVHLETDMDVHLGEEVTAQVQPEKIATKEL